jgi:hypothetical protein
VRICKHDFQAVLTGRQSLQTPEDQRRSGAVLVINHDRFKPLLSESSQSVLWLGAGFNVNAQFFKPTSQELHCAVVTAEEERV